ncbi:histidine--tRNA ligase [Pseudochelatococcus sp. B33]
MSVSANSGSENQKPQKLLARQPRGFADRGPADIAATERMLAHIRETYELYGFDAVETPFVEYTDALGKFLPDQDRPNEGVFSFQDDDEQWLSLRYDLTAPLARHVAENYDTLPKPYRSYRAGWVFRNEKPGPGRFRQFMQFDADTVGAASVSADAEICMMAADTLERVGIARGAYAVKINNRKVLDGVLEAIGLGDDVHAARRLTVLRAIDKLDRLGPDGVALLLGEGRKDESGDFTKGAGLDPAQIARVLAFTAARGASAGETLGNLEKVVGGSGRGLEGVAELREIAALVAAAGYDDGRLAIDPAVVRGLEYYTGPVYEAELTFTVAGEDGQPVRFGSIGGGGRYDGLVARFRGEPVPATGFSIGVSRLLAALKIVGSPIVQGAAPPGPVVVLVLDRDEIAHYQRLVTRLREAGIRAELYLGSSGLKAQMKYADRRQSPAVVIQGSNERAEGTVQIKDLVAGAEQAAHAGQDLDNAAYKAQRLAQFSVSESELVEAVRGVLARQGG